MSKCKSVQAETDVRKYGVKKSGYPTLPARLTFFRIRWMRHVIAAGFAILIVLMSFSIQPVPNLAAQPSPEPSVSLSPTPVQVTPPPKGASAATNLPPPDQIEMNGETWGTGDWIQSQNWLLPFDGGILVWAAGSVTLLAAVTLLFLFVQRRRRFRPGPLLISSVPFLKAPDGSLYLRLDGLDEDGIIIGRAKTGVDLQIEEATPYSDTVSNRHARIYYDSAYDNVVIEDLDSTNGVFINGRQAPRKNLLKDGWEVSLGNLRLTYYDGESDTGPLD